MCGGQAGFWQRAHDEEGQAQGHPRPGTERCACFRLKWPSFSLYTPDFTLTKTLRRQRRTPHIYGQRPQSLQENILQLVVSALAESALGLSVSASESQRGARRPRVPPFSPSPPHCCSQVFSPERRLLIVSVRISRLHHHFDETR